MRVILGAALVAITLAGCATSPKPIVTAPLERPDIVLPGVDRIKARDVEWIVVTQDNVDSVFADLQKKGANLVLFAVTDKGYEAISLNMADLLKLVSQQKTIIGAYEAYYKKSS